MEKKLYAGGRIVIPKWMLKKLGINDEEVISIELVGDKIIIKKI